MSRTVRFASDEDHEIARRLERDDEREPRPRIRRRRFDGESAFIRAMKVGADPGGEQ